ncbi:hypothetical protein J2Z44_003170 [Clostridium punense]|uniref:Lipoprotein n=1 Tax=Clostridium punense TaxID=1054297 RepID=A0ABS4K6C5_9CLOT|nr:hypothetical protein M918_00130 [Clostridium sp. BL8]MBP2023333.1 hypothetical protein [Clostridium punense]
MKKFVEVIKVIVLVLFAGCNEENFEIVQG